tara:strand:+ start:993 stop:1502 length:510 start_codon:yes stop_codon:yes gene_type:complete
MAIITLNNNSLSSVTSLPAAISTGKVLQVVTDELTTNVSTNSDSYSDISGLSVTITPSSTSSKIYVIANLCSARGSNSSFHSCNIFFNLVRGSTELNASRLNYYAGNGNTAREVDGTITLTNLDEPNTTSATTYKCQFKCLGSSNYTAQINQSTDNSPVSSITAMEISG